MNNTAKKPSPQPDHIESLGPQPIPPTAEILFSLSLVSFLALGTHALALPTHWPEWTYIGLITITGIRLAQWSPWNPNPRFFTTGHTLALATPAKTQLILETCTASLIFAIALHNTPLVAGVTTFWIATLCTHNALGSTLKALHNQHNLNHFGKNSTLWTITYSLTPTLPILSPGLTYPPILILWATFGALYGARRTLVPYLSEPRGLTWHHPNVHKGRASEEVACSI